MPKSNWREYAKPIIAAVLSETTGQDEKAIQKALRDAYPFGARENHPYQIWLSEIAIQRGKRKLGQASSKVRKRISEQDALNTCIEF